MYLRRLHLLPTVAFLSVNLVDLFTPRMILLKPSFPLLLLLGTLLAGACNTTRQQHHNQNATPAIHGKRWILARFADTVFHRPEKPVYLLFEKESASLTGFGGCNGLRGNYQANGQSLQVGTVATTKMWCNHAQTEQFFLQVLEQTDGYKASEDSLALLQQDRVLASFYSESIH